SGRPPSRSARCHSARRRSTSSRSHNRQARTCPATSTSSAPTQRPSRAWSGRRLAPSPRPLARTPLAPSSARADVRIGARSRAACPSLLPLQRSLPPDVDVRDHEDRDEEEELEEAEPGKLVEDDGQRIQKDDLDVEDDEEHRRQVEADRETLRVGHAGRDARLERKRSRPTAAMWTRREDE